MTVTQRGQLSENDCALLIIAMERWEEAETLQAKVRNTCVEMIAKSSFREVERLTGFSTNTLQRWKREMGK